MSEKRVLGSDKLSNPRDLHVLTCHVSQADWSSTKTTFTLNYPRSMNLTSEMLEDHPRRMNTHDPRRKNTSETFEFSNRNQVFHF